MPAIALRDLSIAGPDGQIYALLPGDDVPGYDAWQCAIKRALREQEHVRDLDDESLVLSSEGGRLHLAVFGAVKTAPVIKDVAPQDREGEPLDGLYPCRWCNHSYQTRGGLHKHSVKKHPERQ